MAIAPELEAIQRVQPMIHAFELNPRADGCMLPDLDPATERYCEPDLTIDETEPADLDPTKCAIGRDFYWCQDGEAAPDPHVHGAQRQIPRAIYSEQCGRHIYQTACQGSKKP